MAEYTYARAKNADGSWNAPRNPLHSSGHDVKLSDEISTAIPGLGFNIRTAGTVLKIVTDRDLTTGEETTLDTTVADHKSVTPVTSIELCREKKMKRLKEDTRGYIESHYSPPDQRTLMHMDFVARNNGLTNREALIESAWTWIDSVITYFYTLRDAVEAALDEASVNAVMPDFTPYNGTDPLVTIEGARAILD